MDIFRLLGMGELRSYREIPHGILNRIKDLRKNYQEFQAFHFQSSEDLQAYYLFWLPRQIEILRVFLELARPLQLQFPIWDYGCGAAPGMFLFLDSEWAGWDLSLKLVEDVKKKLGLKFWAVEPEQLFKTFTPKTVLFQMSYGEIKPSDEEIKKFLDRGCDVIVIEPGTLEHGRRVIELRNRFSEYVVFPCPQVEACPLTGMASEWCMGRREWSAPVWYQSLAQHLKVDVRFLKMTGVWLSSSQKNQTSSRVVSIPKKVGSKKAGIFEWDACEEEGLKKTRAKTKEPAWPWD